ncbi:MAG: hypothetical protein M1826_001060 [Phylliscum demangeonii]|nr:MAG: hypothetical protein M1826_001060 [Phylliscum demangeonii]
MPSRWPAEALMTGARAVRPRQFHDYFVTHLPSSSLHLDPRSMAESGPGGVAVPGPVGHSRETTVVRIPLQSAKLHFGAATVRGTRPHNEDMWQAGVIDIPAFAHDGDEPRSAAPDDAEATSAEGSGGDPQVFYFGIFDGHGGAECSTFLKERLHTYIEDTAKQLHLVSSRGQHPSRCRGPDGGSTTADLERLLVRNWGETVGGYFSRFRPGHFSLDHIHRAEQVVPGFPDDVTLEAVLTYAFLQADLDFIGTQAKRMEDDLVRLDRAVNEDEILGEISRPATAFPAQSFNGGSTCSVAMISTATATPFWDPRSASTLVTSHVGDSRILLSHTGTGQAIPLTTVHHPSSSGEGSRLQRFAASVVTDSFGEERLGGLANTRAFGDINSKRLGVSAEPELRRLHLGPAEHAFLVLVSDGISGPVTDQEIVDLIKESGTPEQGARDVVAFATEVGHDGDNATCMVVRLGGWEQRLQGGAGAVGTKALRDRRRQEAVNPRSRRT